MSVAKKPSEKTRESAATSEKMIPNCRKGSIWAKSSGTTAQSVVMDAETIDVHRARNAPRDL
eukprot:7385090-Prymnesium_polylepis.1